ncbi:hypothetical protein VNI00_006047 [Paramarasmius palmivorus]|uniref:Cytochrome P450 n=1 Tax=Paramarasmius palmivorus TaxID=297713 RepID=A0AAW0DH02_9AGAR
MLLSRYLIKRSFYALRRDMAPTSTTISRRISEYDRGPPTRSDTDDALTAAIALGIVYGQDVHSADDHLVALAEKANKTLITLGSLSAAIVNMFPFLRHFPAWFPGCGFQKIAREARSKLNSMVEKPYFLVVNQMNSSAQKPSVLAQYLDRYHVADNKQDIQTIKQVCVMAYAERVVGGAETTASSIATFFLAMAAHPHVQKKAQEHIDDLLGDNRLPTLRDRPKLHYIEAIMRECFRWRPVGPLGFPHSALSDDMVNGYYIPKGQ